MSGRKKSRRIRDILELLYHDMSCSSSVMKAEVITPYFDENQEDISQSYQVKLELFVIEGSYRNGYFNIILNISKDYPFKGPTFYTTEPLWHPNIDLHTGQIFLPIEWSPVIRLYSIVFALQLLFLEPSDETIVNYEAGQLINTNSSQFDGTVQSILHGGMINGIQYPNYILKAQSCWCVTRNKLNNENQNNFNSFNSNSTLLQSSLITTGISNTPTTITRGTSDWYQSSCLNYSSQNFSSNNQHKKRNHSNMCDMMSQEQEQDEYGYGYEHEHEGIHEDIHEEEEEHQYQTLPLEQSEQEEICINDNDFNQWNISDSNRSEEYQRHNKIEWYDRGRKKRGILMGNNGCK